MLAIAGVGKNYDQKLHKSSYLNNGISLKAKSSYSTMQRGSENEKTIISLMYKSYVTPQIKTRETYSFYGYPEHLMQGKESNQEYNTNFSRINADNFMHNLSTAVMYSSSPEEAENILNEIAMKSLSNINNPYITRMGEAKVALAGSQYLNDFKNDMQSHQNFIVPTIAMLSEKNR